MCNIKFKVGDKVILSKSISSVLKKGTTGVVLDSDSSPYIQFNVEKSYFLHNAERMGAAGKCFSVAQHSLELYRDYKLSNRFKLLQAIKETGYSSRRLSDIAVGNESYFYNYTGKARFDKKGDITEDRLNSLLTTLAFAERELLGVGAKTVESGKTYKPSQVKLTIDDVEIKYAVVESCGLSYNDYPLYDSTVHYPAEAKVNHNGEIKFAADVKIEEAKKDLDSFLLYPTDKPELSNFTKVGIIAIVILLLILIVKNLVV